MIPEKISDKTHAGHRKRKKLRFLKEGAESFSDTDILEMLLYYAVPRADTRPMAESLIKRFGSLDGVLKAEKGEVSKTSGLKDNAEFLFALLRAVTARTIAEQPEPLLLEDEVLKKYLIDLYREVPVETVYALYFASGGIFVGKQLVFRGGISSARFSLRKVTEGAIRAGGTSVVLAHNHPSKVLAPSTDDIISTKRIAAHLAANEIDLIEHYIVGKDDCVGIFRTENIY